MACTHGDKDVWVADSVGNILVWSFYEEMTFKVRTDAEMPVYCICSGKNSVWIGCKGVILQLDGETAEERMELSTRRHQNVAALAVSPDDKLLWRCD